MKSRRLVVSFIADLAIVVSCTFAVGAVYAEESTSGEYTLVIYNKSGDNVSIPSSGIDLHLDFDSILDVIPNEQIKINLVKDLENLGFSLNKTVTYSKDKLEAILDSTGWTSSDNALPTDAYITFSDAQSNYVIVPETEGNTINRKTALEIIDANLQDLNESLNLYEANAYEKPNITADMLASSLQQLNDLTDFIVTYTIGDSTFKFGVEQMKDYVSLNDAKVWVLDSTGAAKEFISTLKSELDTYGDDLTFTTTQGKTITVPGGNWGWRLDTESTKQKLIEQISTGEDAVGELVWTQRATLYGDKEFVNYVEIDMGDQHLYLYTNNTLVGDWPIVTGTYTNTGRRTPEGVYILNYKTTDTYLRGPTWNSWVMYWMPFNGGIGMHDANWRSSFGGNIYMYNGSHGCINMPTEGAKTVYNAIDKTYAIICYY